MTQLITLQPFGAFKIGNIISDANQMHQILQGLHAHHVVRVMAPSAGAEHSKEA